MDTSTQINQMEQKMDDRLVKIEAQNTAIMHALQKKKKGIIFVSFTHFTKSKIIKDFTVSRKSYWLP